MVSCWPPRVGMMSVEKALQSFKGLQARGEITAWVKIPAKPGSFTDLPEDLSSPLSAALKQKGIRRLYSHQAEAFDLSQRNQNTVVVTPTASGKTLCYNLPVLEDLLRNPQHGALYLFPTKALAQDQLAELRELIAAIGAPIGVQTYDGDTPADQRRKIRLEARIILTNPDMLHSAILPQPSEMDSSVSEPSICRSGRPAHLPGNLRQPRRQPVSPTQEVDSLLQDLSSVHLYLGHHREPGGIGAEAGG